MSNIKLFAKQCNLEMPPKNADVRLPSSFVSTELRKSFRTYAKMNKNRQLKKFANSKFPTKLQFHKLVCLNLLKDYSKPKYNRAANFSNL